MILSRTKDAAYEHYRLSRDGPIIPSSPTNKNITHLEVAITKPSRGRSTAAVKQDGEQKDLGLLARYHDNDYVHVATAARFTLQSRTILL